MKTTRVAVHAFDSITKAGLTSYLQSRPEITVVDRAELTERDVLVVQVDRMTQAVVTELKRQAAEMPVPTVLLAGELQEHEVITAVECRVVAVLPRTQASGDRLVETLQSVASGRGAMPPDLLGQLLDNVRRLQRDVLSPRGLGSAGLTAREVDILRLIADGRDTAEIAEELCYSERTVKSVIYSMTSRLNLRNRPHAVAYALRAGVI
ncbi:response regulator transcription factor [Amycolatopsis sp. WQ 127309]|uniref:helix-turn-helix transcriptional regulator n=1 Tax=Amycolatopsis sp. WQ 127309 TaxID=2932773 RepID=UPI001FF59FB3|nr:response regulator transcription factor [Amycolatopsis sp. WQ 127309]UOZ06950.1 response regulator transcription factor [Amycolatopsis sp. WQ 127309]